MWCDFKTSKQVWKEYELQVSAYRMALENGENPLYEKNENGTETDKLVDMSGLKTAILQVGYERNKAGYKFTEVDDAFPLFKVAQQIWKAEIGDNKPGFTKREFPIVLSPAAKKPEPEPQIIDEVGEVSPEIFEALKRKLRNQNNHG